MWFMNKIANPFVGLILHSPLHGLMSSALLLITYQGRKSGKEYTLPVQYAIHDQMVYIVPGMAEQKVWWRNLRCGAPVRLTLRGKTVTGQGCVLQNEADAEAIARGLRIYLEKFPATAGIHNIRLGEDGSFNQDDLRRAARTTIVVRVALEH